MKALSEVALRYARALFSLSANGKRETALGNLRLVARAISSDPGTYKLVTSPVITRREKALVIGKILDKLDVMDEVANFVRLLAQKGRLDILDQIVWAYELISDEANQVLRGTVWSQSSVKDDEKKQITKAISNATQRQVILDFKEDASLIGGLAANVGSFSFDGSLKTNLKDLKENLQTH